MERGEREEDRRVWLLGRYGMGESEWGLKEREESGLLGGGKREKHSR